METLRDIQTKLKLAKMINRDHWVAAAQKSLDEFKRFQTGA